jgi:hypothetical protein
MFLMETYFTTEELAQADAIRAELETAEYLDYSHA